MKLLVMSDLHLEFHRDDGEEFIGSLDPVGIDALVLAGDITILSKLKRSMELFHRRFGDTPIVYVPGNHEYYGSSREAVTQGLAKVVEVCPNLKVLDREVVEVKGRRIMGCTLWFPYDPVNRAWESNLNDFNCIERFRSWVYKVNKSSVEFLTATLDTGDVVVTHHAPSYWSVNDTYRSSSLNRFYVTPLDELILKVRPSLWVHGHMHSSFDYPLGDTRVVCNPYGYKHYELNKGFDKAKVIEV